MCTKVLSRAAIAWFPIFLASCSSSRILTIRDVDVRAPTRSSAVSRAAVDLRIQDKVGKSNLVHRNQGLSSVELTLPDGFLANFRRTIATSLTYSGIPIADDAKKQVGAVFDQCEVNYDLQSAGTMLVGIWNAQVSILVLTKERGTQDVQSYRYSGSARETNFWGWSDAEKAFMNAYAQAVNNIDWNEVLNGSSNPLRSSRWVQPPQLGNNPSPQPDLSAARARLNMLLRERQNLESQKAQAQQSLSLYERTSSTNGGLIGSQTSLIRTYQMQIDQKNNEINLLILQLGNR